MAFDGLFLGAIVKELKDKLKETRLDKIHQPESDELALTFKNRNAAYKLLITSASNSARVHITRTMKQNPVQAPLFTMVLRKYLQSAKLENIEQINGDRIINFYFLSSDEMGFDSKYILSVEIMGRHSNIILIRERDKKILESIKHVGLDQNSYRTILPGSDYRTPPSQNKLNPYNFNWIDIGDVTNFDSPKVFSEVFNGISGKTSDSLHQLFKRELKNLDVSDIDLVFKKKVLGGIITKSIESDTFYIYQKDGRPDDISLIEINGRDNFKSFNSPSEALETYYIEKDSSDRVREKSLDIIKILSNNIDRAEKKIKILENTIEESKEKDLVRLKGELLQANLYNLNDGIEEAILENYYDNNTPLKVSLDPHKSISWNMQNYFRRYNKLKRSEEMASEQLILAREELTYLNTVSDSVMRSESQEDIDEIRHELTVAGYIRLKSGKKKKESPSKPMKFISSEGIIIYVGKNNLQNDYLTTKFADSNDTWLHTKNYPGSHVIIKSKNFNDETLLEAANLAAFFSKASNGTKVEVDYTPIKYVKKPNGAKPGMVIYTTNKTVYVDPEAPRIERL